MTLKELIAYLEKEDPAKVAPLGFASPHSYRGYYDQLAFEPAENVTVGSMLACAQEALGKTYTGYKGGQFRMDADTDVHIARYGECGEEIGTILLGYMLGRFLE
jgi:ABC-type cobalt transport system substrate-binding protein